jgi:hypothetical protein
MRLPLLLLVLLAVIECHSDETIYIEDDSYKQAIAEVRRRK